MNKNFKQELDKISDQKTKSELLNLVNSTEMQTLQNKFNEVKNKKTANQIDINNLLK
jgi:hypothetical protein